MPRSQAGSSNGSEVYDRPNLEGMMPKIKPIPIKDYICKNCTKLKDGMCELQQQKKHEKDMACSQIFAHWKGK